jgi:hypothetical protein
VKIAIEQTKQLPEPSIARVSVKHFPHRAERHALRVGLQCDRTGVQHLVNVARCRRTLEKLAHLLGRWGELQN